MKKKLLALLLVLVMVLGATVALLADTGNESGGVDAIGYIDFYDLTIVDVFCDETGLNMELINNPEMLESFLYTQERMRLQEPAILAYNMIMREFIRISDYGMEIIYPDDYAGAFIDENNNLVVQLTSLDRSSVGFYNSLVKYSDVVSFVEVEFSLNELHEFGRMFADMLIENGLQVTSDGIDVINNIYDISLYYADEASISFIKSFNLMSRALPIPITIGLGSPMNMLLQGGTAIGTSTRPMAASIGATGIGPRGNVLVTTGHITGIYIGMQITFHGMPIGHVAAFRRGHLHGGNPGSTQGDWAIVSLNDMGISLMTRRMRTGQELRPFPNDRLLALGTTVSGTGFRTLFWSGEIAHRNRRTLMRDGVYVDGLHWVRSRTIPDFGDSGGTVFYGSGPWLEGVISAYVGPYFWEYFIAYSPIIGFGHQLWELR